MLFGCGGGEGGACATGADEDCGCITEVCGESAVEAGVGVAGAECCDPDDIAALTLSLLVVLSKGLEKSTCPGREESELEFPVCCTSGGIGFCVGTGLGRLWVGAGVCNGMIVTAGEVGEGFVSGSVLRF